MRGTCYNSTVKPQVTGVGLPHIPPTVRGPQAPRKSGEPRTDGSVPQDSYAPLRPESAHPSQEQFQSTSPVEVKTPTPIVPDHKPTPLSSAPLLLTTLDDGTPEISSPQGSTLLDLVKSAAAQVSQGVSGLFGDQLTPFRVELDKINQLGPSISRLKTPEQFAAKTKEFKQRLAAGESLNALRPEAYAVAREAASQATGMRAYDCQVLGALAMDDSHISEMKTGEGKTLTAVLPLYLNALAGKGAHLITVNETLAKRDSEWMGPIFERLGMTVGCVTEQQTPEEKRAGYNCDVTYVSDRALGFDFLRDRSVYDPAEKVQRAPFFALVDEVDEVLLDEARTPMIISTKTDQPSGDYKVFHPIVSQLVPGDDFKIDEERQSAWLTDGGLRFVENELVLMEARQVASTARPGSPEAQAARTTVEKAEALKKALRQENALQKKFDDIDFEKPNIFARSLGFNGKYDRVEAKEVKRQLERATAARESLAEKTPSIDLYSEDNMSRLPYLDASLKAHTLFRKGKDYTVENGEVKIVDANKGRVSEGKRYSRGLHQAIEAKEGLEIRAETQAVAKITMPELMAQYERKAGMTGTGKTSEGEFKESYGLDVIEIPPNKPVIRKDMPDVVFSSKETKFQKAVQRAIDEASSGRPVLLGTISVNANRELAARLLKAGWPSDRLQILNADTVRSDADNVDPDAGRSGAITLTTGERAKLVKTDPYNYKKMAIQSASLLEQGKPVLLDVSSEKDAEEVKAWLEGSAPAGIVETPNPALAGVQIRVGHEDPRPTGGFSHLKAEDFRVETPTVLKVTEANQAEVLPTALKAFADGVPVILESATSKQMGESAAFLLDHGLGLNAIPMVCEGKEKENVMIEMAGRSGMITVATNMAGRGADIKPDQIAVTHIAEVAFEKASQNQPTTITVEKESQAVKLQRLLKDHIETTITSSPEMAAKPGRILIRFGKNLPELEGDNHLKGSDFKTGGLLVVGTERAPSRRIDNQLIGRAGRQGAEGESQFYLSLQDDVPRIFGGESLEPLLNLFGDGESGLSSPTVNSFLEKAQQRVENQHYDQRHNASKYHDVHKTQRETWYGMRERLLVGEEDPREFVGNFATQGLARMLKARMGEKAKYDATQLQAELQQLNSEWGLDLHLEGDGRIRAGELEGLLRPQVENLLRQPDLDPGKLRTATLQQIDGSWRDHLESMEILQDGIGLEAYAGREPEKVFPERAFEVFEGTVGQLQERLAQTILPAAARLKSARQTPP